MYLKLYNNNYNLLHFPFVMFRPDPISQLSGYFWNRALLPRFASVILVLYFVGAMAEFCLIGCFCPRQQLMGECFVLIIPLLGIAYFFLSNNRIRQLKHSLNTSFAKNTRLAQHKSVLAANHNCVTAFNEF